MSVSMEEIVMNIVVDSGSCRSYSMEAIGLAKEGEFEKAEEALRSAEGDILKAHLYQTDLIQREACGEKFDISLLLVHSQDHIMTAIVVKDLAKEFVQLYRKLREAIT